MVWDKLESIEGEAQWKWWAWWACQPRTKLQFEQIHSAIQTNSFDKTRQIHFENETNWKVLKEWHNESDGLGALANWLHSKLRILRRLLLSKEEKTSAVVAPQIVIENFLAAKKQDLKVMKSVIPQFLWFPHRRFLLSVFGTAKISQLCVLIRDQWSHNVLNRFAKARKTRKPPDTLGLKMFGPGKLYHSKKIFCLVLYL